jgi:hypothetical protein
MLSPEHNPKMKRRSAALFLAVICWLGLVLQIITAVLRAHREGTSVLTTLWHLIGYFTITTNTIVAVLFTTLAASRPGTAISWASRPGVLAATTVHIAFVGIAYSVLLRGTWHPQGLSLVADEIVHDVVPLLTLLFWFRYAPKGRLRWGQLPHWLSYPAAYLAYALIRGAAEGWYPYYFIDVKTQGYPATFRMAGVIMVVLIGMCAAIIAFDHRLRDDPVS